MSLRLRAILIAGISLVVLWGAATAWMIRDVQIKFDRTLDGRLAMSARMVAGLLERSTLSKSISNDDFSNAIGEGGVDGIACEIRSLRGEVLAKTDDSPDSEFGHLAPGYSTRKVDGRDWRIYVLRADGYQITTADCIDQRNVLINELLYAAGIPFLIALLGGLGALWIGIGRGFAPLKALHQQLHSMGADDTTPLVVRQSPAELHPVLEAMNGLLKRLAQALSSQRAFTDAAAHELRTPLTVIDTHLQVVRMTEGKDAESSLSQAEEGVKRLRHTLDQMMMLAQAESATDSSNECPSVLTAVHNVLDRVSNSGSRRLSLAVEGAEAGTPIPSAMLETAVRNIVDNAVRYSPEDTPVEVKLFFDHRMQRGRIDICDQGPGLNMEQVSKVGRRFWRGDQGRQQKDGAGLGISIVRTILERFGGSLDFSPRQDGGLTVSLNFPLNGGTPEAGRGDL
ncbi:MAG: sensor histidine kinase N-terminal domain-containing protein [Rhodocyclaceae bacterium]|nr:sensor histidine kinase N-terminal domain-containing protein [Rhodocyclaceae bacterium]